MDKKKKMEEAIASLMKSNDREAFAELMVEYVKPEHIATDFVGMLLNSRNLKAGDALVKKLRKGIEVRTLVPGSIHLASEITVTERMNWILDGADVKVTWNEWELEAGDIGSVEEMRGEMLAKLKDYFQNKVFTALTTVWTAVNTPNNFINAGGAITETILKDGIDYINQTVGKVKAVVGIRAALTPITTFGSFWKDTGGTNYHGVDSQLEEVMKTGWLGTYYGAEIIALDQQWDNPEDYNTLLPTDKILIIGENVGEFVTYDVAKWKQWTDMRPTPPQYFLELYQRFGLIIDKANGIYVVGGIS
jgi:hypothetical protein